LPWTDIGSSGEELRLVTKRLRSITVARVDTQRSKTILPQQNDTTGLEKFDCYAQLKTDVQLAQQQTENLESKER